jgi:hypothetical protein
MSGIAEAEAIGDWLRRLRGVAQAHPRFGDQPLADGALRRTAEHARLWGWRETKTAPRLPPVGPRLVSLGVRLGVSAAVGQQRALGNSTIDAQRMTLRADGRTRMAIGKTIVAAGISSGVGARWINGVNPPVAGAVEASVNAGVLGF